MPSFRGIEISIIAQPEIGKLPEYPHPNRSCLQSPDVPTPQASCDDQPRYSGIKNDHTVDNSPADDSKSNPRIPVYIQSLPGSQFWISYVVEHEPSTAKHLFFKLYMNGRHITSWGIDPRIKSNGLVEKALYEPCSRWDHAEDDVIFKPQGIEARYFYFLGDQHQLSVADDGGLIEVQVFRAKGRKRRAAKLDAYRQMDKYGITAPSGGLVDNPQDVMFFDFHLIDPKDTPFATFQFHYRSLANLHQLNLVPVDGPSFHLPPPTNTTQQVTESISKSSFTILEDDSCIEEQLHPVRQKIDESVFEDSDSSVVQSTPAFDSIRPRRNSSYILRTPPQLRPRSATSYNLPQPSKTLRDALPPWFPESYLSRPLPELPVDGPNDVLLPRSRKTSTASAAPSVAPSLLSYVQNDSYLEEPVEYGQGREVPINKDYPGVALDKEKVLSRSINDSIHAESSIPVDSLGVTAMSMSNPSPSLLTEGSVEDNLTLVPPGNYIPTTGSRTGKHIGRLEEMPASPGGGSDSPVGGNSPRKKRGDTVDLAIDLSRFPHLQLSESEWIRQTPSPQHVPRRILSPRLGRLWNTLRRNKSRSPLRSTRGEASSRNYSTPHLPGLEVKERSGKWI